VREAFYRHVLEKLEHRLHVDSRRREDEIRKRTVAEVRIEIHIALRHDPADERVAVRVRAVACEAEHDVPWDDLRPVDNLRLFHDTHGETGEVVFTGRIHAGHLRGLAADQGAARVLAALRDTFDDLRRSLDVELAARVVIEEEKRLGAEREDVVHAHRDEIDADRVVAVELEGELQLRSDAVGARHEHRLLIAFRHFEERAEAADAREHAGAHRAARVRLDAIDERVARVDVDAGVAVRERAFSRC
jgi:hypothetical protein